MYVYIYKCIYIYIRCLMLHICMLYTLYICLCYICYIYTMLSFLFPFLKKLPFLKICITFKKYIYYICCIYVTHIWYIYVIYVIVCYIMVSFLFPFFKKIPLYTFSCSETRRTNNRGRIATYSKLRGCKHQRFRIQRTNADPWPWGHWMGQRQHVHPTAWREPWGEFYNNSMFDFLFMAGN